MAYPIEDTNHVAEATAFLTDHYRTKVVIPQLLQCYINRIQELETVYWAIINSFLLANNPVGDQLNKLGSIVGAERDPAMTDADYLQTVRIQIRVNRSQGIAEDIIDVATLALNGASLPLYVEPTCPYPVTISWVNPLISHPIQPQPTIQQEACFSVDCIDVKAPNTLARLLAATRSTGVYGELHYTTWTPGNDLKWGSVYDATAGHGGFGSVYDVTAGSLLAAGAVC